MSVDLRRVHGSMNPYVESAMLELSKSYHDGWEVVDSEHQSHALTNELKDQSLLEFYSICTGLSYETIQNVFGVRRVGLCDKKSIAEGVREWFKRNEIKLESRGELDLSKMESSVLPDELLILKGLKKLTISPAQEEDSQREIAGLREKFKALEIVIAVYGGKIKSPSLPCPHHSPDSIVPQEKSETCFIM